MSIPQEVIQKANRLSTEVSQLRSKISELDNEMQEHLRVIKTLQPLESGRRAFRLIGGVLVEKTVGEVLPAIEEQHKQLLALIETLSQRVVEREKELQALQKEYKFSKNQGGPARAQVGNGPTGILA